VRGGGWYRGKWEVTLEVNGFVVSNRCVLQ
jgi:hypothetical protein